MAAAKNNQQQGRSSDCIFCKIVEGGLPSYTVYEDSSTLAFLDIFPIHVNGGYRFMFSKVIPMVSH